MAGHDGSMSMWEAEFFFARVCVNIMGAEITLKRMLWYFGFFLLEVIAYGSHALTASWQLINSQFCFLSCWVYKQLSTNVGYK